MLQLVIISISRWIKMRLKSIVFVLLFLMMLPATLEVQASSTVIEINEETAVYDNRSGSLIQVGTLSAGQTFIVKKDYGANWWQIRWGDFDGYVSKRQTTIVPEKTYINDIKWPVKVTNYITATGVTPIFDNTDSKLVQFATLSEGVKYPIYSKSGDWYGIAVNSRLGFVHKKYVAEEGTTVQPTPPPVQSGQNSYIEATENASLYDFRRQNKTMVIATLLKGQQLKVENADDPTYVKVRWGKTFVYAEKSKVKFVNTPSYNNIGMDSEVKKQHFIPISGNSEIYDKSTGKLIPFAKLDTNHRYPILREDGSWYVTTIGGREGYIHSSKIALDRGVPVLMYHHLLKAHELGRFTNVSTTMTDTQFANEMQYLKNKNYETVSIYELQQFMRNEITLPAYSIVLTFDDGLLSTLEYAYPILKQHGFKATQFLITHRNEHEPTDRTFDYKDLQAISRPDMENMRDVFTYESHTYNLHDMVGKTGSMLLTPYHEVVQDLKRSLTIIPDAKAFAYPFGQYNINTIDAVKEAGFTMAFSTKPGYNNPDDDLYQIKRLYSDQKTTFAQYQKMVLPYEK